MATTPNKNQDRTEPIQTLLPTMLVQPKDTEYYKSQYTEFELTAAEREKYQRMMLLRINANNTIKQTY